MFQKNRLTLAFLGLGVWTPALYLHLLRLDWDPSAAFAAILAVLLCLAAAAREGGSLGLAPFSFSAAVLVSGIWLLPSFGERKTFVAGIPFLPAFFIGWTRSEPREGPGPAIALGLAAAAAVPMTRCLSLLLGHAAYAAVLSFSALGAGAGLGAWAARRAPPGHGSWGFAASGLAGLLSLGFLRFIGINAGGGEYVQAPLLTPWDLVFLAGQAWAAMGIWAFAVSFSAASEPGGRWGRLAAAAAGPAAGLALLRLTGAAPGAACADFGLLLAGLWLIGPAKILRDASWRGAAAAAALLGAWAGWSGRAVFHDIWLYRFSLAKPGGDLSTLREDGEESLSVYINDGRKVLVSGGAAQFSSEKSDRHAAHIPLALRPGCARALFLGVRAPRVIDSALIHDVALDAVDPNPAYAEILKTLRPADFHEAPAGKLTVTSAPIRRFLAAPGPRYGAILVQLASPLHAPGNAFLTTLEAFSAERARLEPDGILAMRLPQPVLVNGPERILRTLSEVFPHASACPLEGSLLVLASAQPFEVSLKAAGDKRVSETWIDDPDLEKFLSGGPCRELERSAGLLSLPLETDDRPRGAFPLSDLLETRR